MNQKNQSGKGILLGLAALAVGLSFAEATAATYTWIGVNGNMDVAANWGGTLPIDGNTGVVDSGNAKFNANLFTPPGQSAPAEIQVNTGGQVTLSGIITENHNVVLDGGTFGAGGTSWSYAGTTRVKSDSTLTGMALKGTLADYDGSNTGKLVKQDAGRLTLSGTSSTFSGGMDVLAGELQVSADNATGTGNVTVASGASLNYNTSVSLSSTIVLDGGKLFGYFSHKLTAPIQVKSDSAIGVGVNYGVVADYPGQTGKLTKVDNSILRLVAANTFSGELAIDDGTVILEHVGAMSSGINALSFVPNAGGKLLNLGGHSITVSSLSGGSGTGSAVVKSDPYDTAYGVKSWTDATLTVNNLVDCTYAGVFSDGTRSDYGFTRNLNLLKSGLGTLTLNGASSTDWTRGSKTLNGGTLVVGHADALGTGGTITVNNGATFAVGSGVIFLRPVTFNAGSILGGSGTYNPGGSVVVANGMAVAPGLSPGRLTLPDTTFGDDVGEVEKLLIELGGTTPGTGYDQLAGLSGATLTIASGTELEISLYGGYTIPSGATFQILDWDAIVGTFEVVSLPALTGLLWDTSGLYTTGTIAVAAIPEPTTLSVLVLSGVLLLQRRRRVKKGAR